MAVGDKKKSVMQFDIDTASLSNDATHVPSSPLVKRAIDALDFNIKNIKDESNVTSYTLSVPSNSVFFIILSCGERSYTSVFSVESNATGKIDSNGLTIIQKHSNITLTPADNQLTISFTTAHNIYLTLIRNKGTSWCAFT